MHCLLSLTTLVKYVFKGNNDKGMVLKVGWVLRMGTAKKSGQEGIPFIIFLVLNVNNQSAIKNQTNV